MYHLDFITSYTVDYPVVKYTWKDLMFPPVLYKSSKVIGE